MKSFRTYNLTPETRKRNWHVVDAEGEILGRLATRIAAILRGKDKPEFTPHVDSGDFVIVVNADKIKTTGRKLDKKIYYRHTGYPGGLKETSLRTLLQHKPERAIYYAVKGMLPKNKLSKAQLKKLKVYAGSEHPHQAQQPRTLQP
ncbi:MAG: 50S ribosomal protein L13 [Desulfohalobiaceae bacterium]|nr:50S ribosomal protein L13 [Desulfohalobiaceae bacterium]